MLKTDLTIIIPWFSQSDWTSLIFSSLKKEADRKKIKFNLIIGECIGKKKKVGVKAKSQIPQGFTNKSRGADDPNGHKTYYAGRRAQTLPVHCH